MRPPLGWFCWRAVRPGRTRWPRAAVSHFASSTCVKLHVSGPTAGMKLHVSEVIAGNDLSQKGDRDACLRGALPVALLKRVDDLEHGGHIATQMHRRELMPLEVGGVHVFQELASRSDGANVLPALLLSLCLWAISSSLFIGFLCVWESGRHDMTMARRHDIAMARKGSSTGSGMRLCRLLRPTPARRSCGDRPLRTRLQAVMPQKPSINA